MSPRDNYFLIFFKGAAMGAANVIPGVSGGTIAFITGIYERLIGALRGFDLVALKLARDFKFRSLAKKVDLWFLAALGAGVLASLLTVAKLLKALFRDHEVMTWAFFFGLILASVYFVGNMVRRWGVVPVAALIFGVVVAAGIAFLKPASQNDSVLYLVLCGVVAICSMIVPGLSGSFVLILMGNYTLVMLDAVPSLNLKVLLPVAVGAGVGIIVFARFLDWVFKKHHDTAVALLTGFVAGSLLIIWPWKNVIPLLGANGEPVLRRGEVKVAGYEWILPDFSAGGTWLAFGLVVLGVASVWFIEKTGSSRGKWE